MRKGGKLFTGLCLILSASALVPSITQAAFGEADAFCAAKCLPFWQKKPGPQPCVMACKDTTNSGVTTGKCNPMPPGKCIGTGFNTPGGDMKGAGDIGKFLEQALGIAGKIMEMAKKGGGGGGSGSGSGGAGYNPGPLYPTCVHNAATNTVSPIPCTDANGSINYGTSPGSGVGTAGSIGGSTADALLKALEGETGTGTNTNTNTNTKSTSDTSSTSPNTTQTTQTKVVIQGEQGSLQPTQNQQGILQGDIVVGESGGMLYVRSRDPQNNTEVAGFYGGSTFGQAQSSSLIGRMCGTRPWGEGVLGGLISGTFFDGLCKRFGYQVGALVVTPGGGGGATTKKRPVITITQDPVSRPATGAAQKIQPEVDIWANPPSVRLGSRTYIFWNTRGVESCIESGPNFSHNTLSGGASTVPLSDASIFTIECKTSDGDTVKDTVRVNLAL